jgi:hypothetical protein
MPGPPYRRIPLNLWMTDCPTDGCRGRPRLRLVEYEITGPGDAFAFGTWTGTCPKCGADRRFELDAGRRVDGLGWLAPIDTYTVSFLSIERFLESVDVDILGARGY